MSKLLINEQPLQFLPTLAKVLKNSDKALILQQINYWLNNPKVGKEANGRRWIRNTVEDWHEQFPWIAVKTVQRYLKDLEEKGILLTCNLNKLKFDRTKWYAIDYDELDKLTNALGQSDQMEKDCQEQSKGTDKPDEKGTTSSSQNGTESPKQYHRLPETTSKTTNKYSASHGNALSESDLKNSFENLWSDYPNKKGKKEAFNHYKAWRKKSAKNTDKYLMTQLKKYLIYCEQNNSWYHPMNGSTWFNGRFDDVLVTDGITHNYPRNNYRNRKPIKEPMPEWFRKQQEKQGEPDQQGSWMDQLPD